MLKIYDEFLEDETILALKHTAYRVHVSALIYCAKNLTDGEITEKAVKVLQVILGFNVRRHVPELVDAGLWIPQDEGGWRIKNYLDFNPSSEVVKGERKAARERMRELRKKRVSASEGSAERSPEHDTERSPAVPSPPIPEPVKTPLGTSSPTSYEGGHETESVRKLAVAAGVRTPADVDKLVRTVRAHKPSEARVVAAIDACTGPGVRDRLAVALSTLTRKEHAA